MRFLGAVFVLAIVIAGIALVYIYAGGYDVAATTPHGAAGRWLLETVMRNSVEAGARNIVPPDTFDDPARVAAGGKMYGTMCQSCHGGPGVKLSELARGLRPEPPDLARTASDWKPRELFWIVKHGVKMTGMPAWGPSHEDAELWSVVAFVRKLPTLTPEAYQAYLRGEGVSEGPKVSSTTDGDAADDAAAPPASRDHPGETAKSTPNGQARDVAEPPPTDTADITPAQKPAATPTDKAATGTTQAMQTGPQPRVHATPEPKPDVPEPPRRRRRR